MLFKHLYVIRKRKKYIKKIIKIPLVSRKKWLGVYLLIDCFYWEKQRKLSAMNMRAVIYMNTSYEYFIY